MDRNRCIFTVNLDTMAKEYHCEIVLNNNTQKLIMTGDAEGIVNAIFRLMIENEEVVELVDMALMKYDLVSGTGPN